MKFWEGEQSIWLRFKAFGAWDGVLGKCVVNLAHGQGMWGLGCDFG
jgi:hypothetical protein